MQIAFEVQQQSDWCWIACFRMACSAYGIDVPPQCTIAQQFLGISGCCPPGSNPACDRGVSPQAIPTLYASARLIAAPMPSPFSDAAFQQALFGDRLVLGFIRFPASFHFVLVESYDAQGYVVDDPRAGRGAAPFDELMNYPGGVFEAAWLISLR